MNPTKRVKAGLALPSTYLKRGSSYFIDAKDFLTQKISRPTIELENRKGRCIPSRYICVILGFLTCILLTTQRINLSMAMVAMVNHTAILHSLGGNSSDSECPMSAEKESNERLSIGHKGRNHLHWDSETQNHILGASFLGYVLTQIPGGRLSETVGAKQVLIFSLILASLCNIVSPVASGWGAYTLMGAQFTKGLAQGLTQPAISCLMARWYPKPEKGFLSSITFSGYPGGAVVGALITGTLLDSDFLGGWPMVFYLFGFLGLLLSFLVYQFSSNGPDDDYDITEKEYKYITSNIERHDNEKKHKTPWRSIVTSVGAWAVFVGMFGQYWMTFYFLSVHPTYIGSVLHFSNTESGYLNSLPFIGQMMVTWSSSYLSDKMVNKGYASTDVVRKVCNSLSCFGFSLTLFLVTYAGCDKMMNIVLFVVAMSSVGFGYPGSNIVPMDMTIRFAGTLMGIVSTFASCAGFIIPLVVGSLTSQGNNLTQWRMVFNISAIVGLVTGVTFFLFGTAKLQEWDCPESEDDKLSGLVNEGFDEKSEVYSIVEVPDATKQLPK